MHKSVDDEQFIANQDPNRAQNNRRCVMTHDTNRKLICIFIVHGLFLLLIIAVVN